jgi:tryptophan-rich sensory protein
MGQHISKPQVIAVATPLILGQLVGTSLRQDTFVWFKLLKKPVWCPPTLAFPAVWTVLYGLMGYASYLVWHHGGGFEVQQGSLTLYGIQLLLNLLWPILFFKQKKLKLAMVENLALLVTAAATATAFREVNVLAGQLMAPYVGWLMLANALNLYIARHNPSGSEDPRLQDLRSDDDLKNPGQPGYRPASASLASNPTATARSRGRLQVFARAANPTPSGRVPRIPNRSSFAAARPTAMSHQIRRPVSAFLA